MTMKCMLCNFYVALVWGTQLSVKQSDPEAMVLYQKTVDCSLWVGSEILPKAKEFKYLGVLLTSEGKLECEMDSGNVAVVLDRELTFQPSLMVLSSFG